MADTVPTDGFRVGTRNDHDRVRRESRNERPRCRTVLGLCARHHNCVQAESTTFYLGSSKNSVDAQRSREDRKLERATDKTALGELFLERARQSSLLQIERSQCRSSKVLVERGAHWNAEAIARGQPLSLGDYLRYAASHVLPDCSLNSYASVQKARKLQSVLSSGPFAENILGAQNNKGHLSQFSVADGLEKTSLLSWVRVCL